MTNAQQLLLHAAAQAPKDDFLSSAELEYLANREGMLDPVTERVGNDDFDGAWIFLCDGSYLVNAGPEAGLEWETLDAEPGDQVELTPDNRGRRYAVQWTGQEWVFFRGLVTLTWQPVTD